jgi:hypothetical protein
MHSNIFKTHQDFVFAKNLVILFFQLLVITQNKNKIKEIGDHDSKKLKKISDFKWNTSYKVMI